MSSLDRLVCQLRLEIGVSQESQEIGVCFFPSLRQKDLSVLESACSGALQLVVFVALVIFVVVAIFTIVIVSSVPFYASSLQLWLLPIALLERRLELLLWLWLLELGLMFSFSSSCSFVR
jgi:hypothetical protein